jgi:hypothetical protein
MNCRPNIADSDAKGQGGELRVLGPDDLTQIDQLRTLPDHLVWMDIFDPKRAPPGHVSGSVVRPRRIMGVARAAAAAFFKGNGWF